MFNGGLIDFSSFIPGLVTMSSAEAELNAAVATAAAMHVRMVVMWFLHGDIGRQFTVPMFL